MSFKASAFVFIAQARDIIKIIFLKLQCVYAILQVAPFEPSHRKEHSMSAKGVKENRILHFEHLSLSDRLDLLDRDILRTDT